MVKKSLIIGVCVIVIALVAFFLIGRSHSDETPPAAPPPTAALPSGAPYGQAPMPAAAYPSSPTPGAVPAAPGAAMPAPAGGAMETSDASTAAEPQRPPTGFARVAAPSGGAAVVNRQGQQLTPAAARTMGAMARD